MNSRNIKPFWKKVFRVAIILYSAGMVLLTVLNTAVAFFALQKKTDNNLDDIIGLSNEVMYSYLNQFDYSINDVSIINELVDLCKNKDANVSLQRYVSTIRETISDFYFSVSGINAIAYRDDDGNFVSVGQIDYGDAKNAFEEVADKGRELTWCSVMAGDKNYLAYYREIGYLADGFKHHRGGEMVIFLDEEQVYKESLANSEKGESRIIVLDSFNTVCCGGLRKYIGREFDDVFTRKGDFYDVDGTGELCYIKYIPSSVNGWKIVGVTPLKDIYAPIILIISISLGVLLICGAIAVFVFYRVLSYMNKPLMRLSQQLKEVKNGHYDAIEEIDDETEIGYLYSSFNDMVSELNRQFNENYLLTLKVKDAYIRTLEKQINPHFIFNTLQLIQMMTVSGKTEDVFNVCGYFGEVVRFNLNQETEIQIREEIENLYNYFKILELRFYGEFEYGIRIPEEIMDFYTIKFLLQPIIENSIQHAFGQKKGKNRIDVSARHIKDEIVFLIKDNGIGIDNEEIGKITEYINDEAQISSSTSVGLRNTNQRIKLLYGSRFGIKLYSRLGKGTTVIIHLPVCREKRFLEKEAERTDV